MCGLFPVSCFMCSAISGAVWCACHSITVAMRILLSKTSLYVSLTASAIQRQGQMRRLAKRQLNSDHLAQRRRHKGKRIKQFGTARFGGLAREMSQSERL